ncbi:MAG: diaminopimelate decarboxylase [Halanaerobiales bacterium]
MEIDKEGLLYIGGLSVKELVKNHGTPLLVIDEEEFRGNIKSYKQGFEENYNDFRIAYGSKAFLNRSICRILAEEGLALDVVSGGELYIALAGEFPPEEMFFHGNNKDQKELEFAIDNKIGRFMIDNRREARLIDKLAAERSRKVKAILRIIPGIEAHTHEYIMTGHIDSKFGVSIDGGQALSLIDKIAKLKNIQLMGLHAHIGSQIFDTESYVKLIEIMFAFMNKVREQKGITLNQLDLGGGLGISHIQGEKAPSIEKFIVRIVESIKNEAADYNYPLPEVIVEPGRSLIGTAGTTLYTVGAIKQVPEGSKYIAIDGGMTDNIRPSLYNAEYEACLANRCLDAGEEMVTIAGKCCESGDILIENIQLPEAREGDILAVPSTGAYTYSMASNYNGLPRPAVVLVKDGQVRLINRRENYQDLLRLDVVPPDLEGE